MYLAIDIGGTKTLIALFSRHGRVIRRRKFKTAQGMESFIGDLERNLADFRRFHVKSITVAVPGVVQKNYSVHFGNRNWDGIDLLTPIKNLFDAPIAFENDANLATLYEAKGLPGRTVFLTFSTGIGGGIVEKGEIVKPDSDKFEPGHRMYTYKGVTREWEDLAAASAIEKVYHVDYATNLRKRKELEDVASRINLGLADIINEVKPNTIVLGGPMGKIFWLYSKYLPKVPGVKYRKPKRPNESVIYGCYLYAKTKGAK